MIIVVSAIHSRKSGWECGNRWQDERNRKKLGSTGLMELLSIKIILIIKLIKTIII